MSRIGRCILPYGGSGGNPDPAVFCPTNGYIDPTLPNDDWLILPKVYPKYGLLYNWYAATDTRNICSAGWHIPTELEWYTLVTFLGGNPGAGDKMREVGTVYWPSPNTGADNSSKFNGRGSEYRNNTGAFNTTPTTYLPHYNSYFHSSNVMSGLDSKYSYLSSTSAWFVYSALSNGKRFGMAIRPFKDSTTLTNGQTGTYIDPSGFVYRTICIGTQEIVADNIKTQHYRDGSAIPEVTDNAAWAALSTGALCAYNNSWSNV